MGILETLGHEAFTVWCVILSNARREPGVVETAEWGNLPLERGQALVSQRGLAEALGGRNRREAARQALRKLTSAGLILQPTLTTHVTTHPPTVVTVSSYAGWVGRAATNNPRNNPPLQPGRVNKHGLPTAKASKKDQEKAVIATPALVAEGESPVVYTTGHYEVVRHYRKLGLNPFGDTNKVLLPAVARCMDRGWTSERLIACIDGYHRQLSQLGKTKFAARLDNFLAEGNFEHYEQAEESGPDWDALAGLK